MHSRGEGRSRSHGASELRKRLVFRELAGLVRQKPGETLGFARACRPSASETQKTLGLRELAGRVRQKPQKPLGLRELTGLVRQKPKRNPWVRASLAAGCVRSPKNVHELFKEWFKEVYNNHTVLGTGSLDHGARGVAGSRGLDALSLSSPDPPPPPQQKTFYYK